MKSDICINIPDGKFNYRVGAIIQHKNRLLMVKNCGDNFYYTVGGRVKFGESARETILREAMEETGIPLEIEKLAFIHENFFTFGPEHEPCHEICLFFQMKPHDKLSKIRQTFNEAYGEVSIHWLPIAELDSYEIYPNFFKTAFANQYPHIQNIVSRDSKADNYHT